MKKMEKSQLGLSTTGESSENNSTSGEYTEMVKRYKESPLHIVKLRETINDYRIVIGDQIVSRRMFKSIEHAEKWLDGFEYLELAINIASVASYSIYKNLNKQENGDK